MALPSSQYNSAALRGFNNRPQVEEQLRRTAEEVVDLRLALQRQREQTASELASARSASEKTTAEAIMLRERLAETEKALEAETADHRYAVGRCDVRLRKWLWVA